MTERINLDQCFVCGKKISEFDSVITSWDDPSIVITRECVRALCESCRAIYQEIRDTINYPATYPTFCSGLDGYLHAVKSQIKEHPDYKGDD